MLTEFFNLNKIDQVARKLLYKQIPEHFVWHNGGKFWMKRKKQLVIGRMVSVGPTEGERYYLRLLLSHCKGPTSFEDLRCVNEVVAETFRDACLARGLLQSDDHYGICFEEATFFGMPSQLRRLFVILLAYCELENPSSIWSRFKQDMIADLSHKGLSSENAEQSALKEIQYMLEMLGRNINDFSIAPSFVRASIHEINAKVIEDERRIPISSADIHSAEMLNTQQRVIFEHVMRCVELKSSAIIFVDGPGGTGKSFLYCALLAAVRKRGCIALATPSSGVAASILPGGRTAHFRFKIPLEIKESMQCNVSIQSGLASLLRIATIIIWDEAPMTHRFSIEAVDRLLQDLNSCSLPFGGKIVVFGGDFRQVLPVVPRGNRSDVANASLVNSYPWNSFQRYKLHHNVRASTDSDFSNYLLQIGNGNGGINNEDYIQIPSDMVLPFVDERTSLLLLINQVY
jgi:hypothetical protein